MITIVMYHYVRDLANDRRWDLNGLSLEQFDGQLDYIQRHYSVVSLAEVAAALDGSADLPDRPCVLTFDDGLRDHHDYVLPRLVDRKLAGCFFPSAAAVQHAELLDVHKIHFILASGQPAHTISAEIFTLLDEARSELRLPSNAELRAQHARPTRFDTAEVALIKRLLQRELPRGIRRHITGVLFRHHVTEDERAFHEQLYLSRGQLLEMLSAGMEVGGHGLLHDWSDTLDEKGEYLAIDESAAFLASLGVAVESGWYMSYPYGAYSSRTVRILRECGCALALTTDVALASVSSNRLALPRLDTNDLPFRGSAEPAQWTRLAAPPGRQGGVPGVSMRATDMALDGPDAPL